MGSKIIVTYISPHSVCENVGHAGGKTLNYYLNGICNEDDIEVHFITVHKNDKTFQQMRSEYRHRIIDHSSSISILYRFFRFIYWKLNLWMIASAFRWEWALIDPLTIYKFKKILRSKEFSKINSNIFILEWTQTLSLIDYIKNKFSLSKVIASEVDVAYQGFQRVAEHSNRFQTYKEYLYSKIRQGELSDLSKADLIFVQSGKDKKLLITDSINENKIHIVSPYYYKIVKKNVSNLLPHRLLFWGALSRWENQASVLWLHRHILPNIFRKYDDVELLIVGGGAPQKFIDYFKKERNIHFTGFVDDPSIHFSKAPIMICPLHFGAGIKVKVIEGMYAGLIVLTGDVGMEGIPAQDKLHYLHCETPSEYINAINWVFQNHELAIKMMESAHSFIETNFDLNQSIKKYSAAIKNIN